jgi:hypothetical protein
MWGVLFAWVGFEQSALPSGLSWAASTVNGVTLAPNISASLGGGTWACASAMWVVPGLAAGTVTFAPNLAWTGSINHLYGSAMATYLGVGGVGPFAVSTGTATALSIAVPTVLGPSSTNGTQAQHVAVAGVGSNASLSSPYITGSRANAAAFSGIYAGVALGDTLNASMGGDSATFASTASSAGYDWNMIGVDLIPAPGGRRYSQAMQRAAA